MGSNKVLGLSALFVMSNFFCSFQALNTITASQYISDTDGGCLVSADGNFKLGFFGKTQARYIGIWLNKIPKQTVVWVANRETPVKNSDGVFNIDEYGNLAIFCCNKSSPIWSTNLSAHSSTSTSTAKLLDSGNLVLTAKGTTVWQSFDFPTDTLIPGMKLGWNFKTGTNHKLTSLKSVDDPAPGDFSAGFDTRSQLFFYKNSLPYRRTGPWNGLILNGLKVVEGQKEHYSNEIDVIRIIFISNNDEMYITFKAKSDAVITIVVLDSMGVLRRQIWHESQKWVSVQVALQELCDEYTRCGANTICQEEPLAYCACLPGFVRLYPEDWYLQCQETGKQGCGKGHGEGFVRLEGVKFPDASNSTVYKNVSLAECESECLKSCDCTGYANPYVDELGHDCIIWYGKLRDMRHYKSGQDFYLRVDAKELAADARKKARHLGATNNTLVFIIVPIVVEMLLASLFLYYLWRRNSKRKVLKHKQLHRRNNLVPGSVRNLSENDSPTRTGENGNTELTLFNLNCIAAATDNFSDSNKLGQGGFGVVYKGRLDGQEVAIKRLSKNSGQGILEFENEVLLIAKLQHRNLVRMLGYCIQKDEKMLIYEFMPNKSLDYFIFDESRKLLLDWSKRFNIILGIARGILYLHHDSRLRIIHRDLKVSNILLGGEMEPKISDFGLAKIFGEDQMQGNTKRVVGTYGYMSPEYALDGIFSVKSDVFSFGFMLLEIISGKKNKGFFFEDPYSNLIQYTWEIWRDGMALQIVDSCIADTSPPKQLERCILVGLLCVQDNPRTRPSMSNVVVMLSNETTLPSPEKSTFSVTKHQPSSSTVKRECSSNTFSDTTITGR